MGYFNSYFNSKFGVIFTPEEGVNFTPYMVCFNSFWSYFNSESGVKILGTG